MSAGNTIEFPAPTPEGIGVRSWTVLHGVTKIKVTDHRRLELGGPDRNYTINFSDREDPADFETIEQVIAHLQTEFGVATVILPGS